jgi:hypothetical protein
MMASTEKISWMATKTPQEGEALYTSDNANGGGKDTKDAGRMVVSVDACGDGGARAGWPRLGTVEFDNVWMKYLPSAPYALKGKSLLLLLVCRLLLLLAVPTYVCHSAQYSSTDGASMVALQHTQPASAAVAASEQH